MLVGVTAGGTACTFLIDFVDAPPDATCADDGGCVDTTAVDAAIADAGGEPRVDADADADANADPCARLEAGAICGYAGGCNCNHCSNGTCSTTKKCAEGFNWEAGNDLARCCGGLAVLTNTNANCGVCGVVCKTAGVANPQDCQIIGGRHLCGGCVGNTECWSQCCSSSPGPSHCAASDCNTGACPAGICPSPSRCVQGAANTPNYCAY